VDDVVRDHIFAVETPGGKEWRVVYEEEVRRACRSRDTQCGYYGDVPYGSHIVQVWGGGVPDLEGL
jgi:hypothetical protein